MILSGSLLDEAWRILPVLLSVSALTFSIAAVINSRLGYPRCGYPKRHE